MFTQTVKKKYILREPLYLFSETFQFTAFQGSRLQLNLSQIGHMTKQMNIFQFQ